MKKGGDKTATMPGQHRDKWVYPQFLIPPYVYSLNIADRPGHSMPYGNLYHPVCIIAL